MLLLTLIFVVLFGLLVYYYLKYAYFSFDDSLPGIPPQFLFGNVLQTGILGRGETLPTVFRQWQAKFGDVFQFWLGTARVIVVSHLEDVQHIFARRHIYDRGGSFINKYSIINPNALICLTEAKFKRHTGVLNSLFRRNKIVGYLNTVVKCTDKLLIRWRSNNNTSTYIHLNLVKQMQQLIIDIFGLIGYDYDLHTLDDENDNCTNEYARALYIYIETSMTFTVLPEVIGRIYLFFNLRYRRAQQIIDQYLNQMIEQERKETSIRIAELKKTTFIALLMNSLQETENFETTNVEENKKGLSRTEMKQELLSLLGGSYGTISTVLAWFIHLMSKHPRVQIKIKKELTENNMQHISVEQLDSLVYLDCVIHELFRFVPPLHSALRTVTIDVQLPASGVQLKKGDQIFISISNLGRDKRYWSESVDPDQFYPERFLIEDNQNNHKKAAWIPFGGGHRLCIGKDLAQFELKIICARLMQYVTFGEGGPEVNSGGYKQTDTIIPKNMGVTITFDSELVF